MASTRLTKARLVLSGAMLSLCGCATTPALTSVHPAPAVSSVEALAATDLSWLSWGVLVCAGAALLAYLLRAHLPFNGTTSRVLLAAALTFAIIRYVLVVVTPFLYTALVVAGLCTATYYALTRGPQLYASLRHALHKWHAGPGE